jgi:zinc protease
VKRVTLENGLTVLMLQRGTLPIVSVEALYKVGSRNEWPGITGAAHYIEHMAFRRTERINKGDLTNQVLRWGGRWGGYTSYDQTVYNAHAPSLYLDWLIFMERQRLQHVLFDAESVELERTSVISELRQYENSPSYTMAEHRLRRAAMVAHPYGSPIMGWVSDLQSVTPADLQRFYRDYYAANNLVLAIVGRFDEEEALALVRKHFGNAPGDGRPTRLRTGEPEQTGARRVVHRGPGSASHLELLVHAPAVSDARYPALLVLDAVLAGGKGRGARGGASGEPPPLSPCRHGPRARGLHGGGVVGISRAPRHRCERGSGRGPREGRSRARSGAGSRGSRHLRSRCVGGRTAGPDGVHASRRQ